LSAPKKIHTVPYRADQSGAADAKTEPTPPAAPIALANASSTAAVAPSVSGGGYAVQVTSERSESNAQAALQALQAKYPNQLSGRQPIIRRADLGAKGIYYRVLVGTFASAEEAAGLCSKLKAAGGNCIVQRN
jgi:cell division septation protein DedD